jgi:LacI family transcriptional regulator
MATAAVVLNGARSSTVVSTETRQRVLEAAAQLGYRPNRAAQTLRRQRSMTVGLAAGPVQNPFFAEMATLCERFLLDAGYELVMAMDAGRFLDDSVLLETLCARGVDGLIMWSERETAGRRSLEEGIGCPAVLFGFPSAHVDSVTTDFGLGARLAVQHFLDIGCRRVGYFCPSEALSLWSGNLRLRAFCDTAREGGVSPAVLPYESTLGDVSRAREAAETLGRSPDCPDALLCFNDLAAIGAMMGLRRAGRRIPEDVAVIGFDDIPLVSYTNPPLTTVRMSAAEVGATAFEALFGLIGGERLEGSVYQVPTKLIVRESTSVPARTL